MASEERISEDRVVSEARYRLADDIIWIERQVPDAQGKNEVEVEVHTSSTNWQGIFPYLTGWGRLVDLAQVDRKILVGSDLGHVECINADTGESLWLYLFPTMRQTMSYSSPHGMPPMYADAAAIYRKENRRRPTSGLQLQGNPPREPRLIVDPEPVNPFAKLPLYLAITWTGVLLPAGMLIVARLVPPFRDWGSARMGAVAIVATLILIAVFVNFGRVSLLTSLLLMTGIVISLLLGCADAVRCCRKKQWIPAMGLAVAFGAMALFVLPYLPFR